MAPQLTVTQQEQLSRIEPSISNGVRLYPCSVKLRDGKLLDCVYMIEAEDFRRRTHFEHPEDFGGRSVNVEDVASILDSRQRLPARFANQLYDAGESGMGYWSFVVMFRWWRRKRFTATSIDFINYPLGMGPSDVKGVQPQIGKKRVQLNNDPEVSFCVFSRPNSG